MDFRLVDLTGKDIVAEAAAFAQRGARYRPSADALELSFRAHNRSFDFRLHRQTIRPDGAAEHHIFRAPGHEAVLMAVGGFFKGTVRAGGEFFDFEHALGGPTLTVAQVGGLPGDIGALGLDGTRTAIEGRRLAFDGAHILGQKKHYHHQSGSCFQDDHRMREFRFGAIVASNVYKKFNMKSRQDAEDWVNELVA